MRLKWIVLIAVISSFLVVDTGLAIPMKSRQETSIEQNEETKVARRRRRRRKPRPKPRPKPAPEETAPAPDPGLAPAPSGGGASLSRTTRIEFDAQLIKGQTTKAGEVQILERKDTELKSMVKRRTSFRDEIIHTVFPEK